MAIIVTGLIAAVLVFMLFAVGAPRLLSDEGALGWWVAGGAAMLTFLIALVVAFMRRGSSPA